MPERPTENPASPSTNDSTTTTSQAQSQNDKDRKQGQRKRRTIDFLTGLAGAMAGAAMGAMAALMWHDLRPNPQVMHLAEQADLMLDELRSQIHRNAQNLKQLAANMDTAMGNLDELDDSIATVSHATLRDYMRNPESSLHEDLATREAATQQRAAAETRAQASSLSNDPNWREAMRDPTTSTQHRNAALPAEQADDTVTLLEFADLRCPYCQATDRELQTVLSDTPGIHHVARDLGALGPFSHMGAAAVLLATQPNGNPATDAQRHDLRQALLHDPDWRRWRTVREMAQKLGLNLPSDDPGEHPAVLANHQTFEALGLRGTPSLLAWTPGRQTVLSLGGQSADSLRALIVQARLATPLVTTEPMTDADSAEVTSEPENTTNGAESETAAPKP